MPSPKPPLVLLEGSYQLMFGSLDELLGWVEAIDVRNGEYIVLDRDGRVIELSAESDDGPVHSRATDNVNAAKLEAALREAVTGRAVRYGLIDADIGLQGMLEALWRVERPGTPFPSDIEQR